MFNNGLESFDNTMFVFDALVDSNGLGEGLIFYLKNYLMLRYECYQKIVNV
jgi:hypothetical protein